MTAWPSEFMIGTTSSYPDFMTLSDLLSYKDVPVDPDATYAPFSSFHNNGDGSRTGIGFPFVTWHWQQRPDAHIEVLRDLCPGLSALVYIRSPLNDYDIYGARVWRSFRGQMLWPPVDEDKNVSRTLGFTLTFRRLIVQPEAT